MLSDLQMVPDTRLEDLFESIIDSSPHPAVDVHALHTKTDLLFREVLVLKETKQDISSTIDTQADQLYFFELWLTAFNYYKRACAGMNSTECHPHAAQDHQVCHLELTSM